MESGVGYALQEFGVRRECADTLNAAARGQEFVADGADREDARLLLDTILGGISAAQPVKAD